MRAAIERTPNGSEKGTLVAWCTPRRLLVSVGFFQQFPRAEVDADAKPLCNCGKIESVIELAKLKNAHVTLLTFLFVSCPVKRLERCIVVCFTTPPSLESSRVYNMYKVQ